MSTKFLWEVSLYSGGLFKVRATSKGQARQVVRREQPGLSSRDIKHIKKLTQTKTNTSTADIWHTKHEYHWPERPEDLPPGTLGGWDQSKVCW
jgi:hypothetical protein